MKYSEIVKKLMDDDGDILEVARISDNAMNRLYEMDPAYYNNIIGELEKLYYKIDYADAVEIVKSMRNKGEVWSVDMIREYLSTKGITDNIINWYLVMNMIANDYGETADRFISGDKTDFYFSMAKDFIFDIDAKPFKVERYFKE